MLYEYNGKIYVKPFSGKMVEVEVFKEGKEYNVKATNKKIELTEEIKTKAIGIALEDAYKKQHKIERKMDLI